MPGVCPRRLNRPRCGQALRRVIVLFVVVWGRCCCCGRLRVVAVMLIYLCRWTAADASTPEQRAATIARVRDSDAKAAELLTQFNTVKTADGAKSLVRGSLCVPQAARHNRVACHVCVDGTYWCTYHCHDGGHAGC